MSPDFIQSLPELIVLVHRDGSVLECTGGRGVPALRALGSWPDERFVPAWPEEVTALLGQLARRAIADRGSSDARFDHAGASFEVRAFAQGQERAVCILRAAHTATPGDRRRAPSDATSSEPDRRGFLRLLNEAVSVARLRESPLAVAVVHLEDAAELGRVTAGMLDRVIRGVLRHARERGASMTAAGFPWRIGQVRDNQLALWMECTDRNRIDAFLTSLAAVLHEPVTIDAAQFRLESHVGVALFGMDASDPRELLDHAAVAAAEARRTASRRVHFFSDTVKLKSLSRLDIARELRAAIDARHVRLRYRFRHDLTTGERTAWVGYVSWTHPTRGLIPPAEFLPIAHTMGLAKDLSRAALQTLRRDFAILAKQDPGLTISFGALRAHALDERFPADVRDAIVDNGLPAEKLEIRLAEGAVVSRDPAEFAALRDLGVNLVADEIGRDLIPLPRLARAPVRGLQLDRAWVSGLPHDALARRMCGAIVGLARSLDFVPLASGVDTPAQRDALLALGCSEGTGDLYGGRRT